jgi:hypothetical protein
MNPNAPVSGALYSPCACQGAGLGSSVLNIRGQAFAVHQQSHFLCSVHLSIPSSVAAILMSPQKSGYLKKIKPAQI